MSLGLYVYCVVGTGEARNFGPMGVGGQGAPVTTIAYRDLSAVVSSVSMDRYVVSQETMLNHERVVEKVMADYTVLPVRFYTVAPNAEEVRGLLRARYGELKSLLRDLDNKVEMGLKVLWRDMEEVLRHAVAQASSPRESWVIPGRVGNSGSHGLRAAVERKKTEVREKLMELLRPLAVDTRLNRTYGDDMIMNAAFLVDRTREREFDDRVQRLSQEYLDTMELKYVGPAPPYSFVNIVIKDNLAAGKVVG